MNIKESIEHFDLFFSSMREHKIFFLNQSNITSILNVFFDGHGNFPQSESKPSNCLFNLNKGIFFLFLFVLNFSENAFLIIFVDTFLHLLFTF